MWARSNEFITRGWRFEEHCVFAATRFSHIHDAMLRATLEGHCHRPRGSVPTRRTIGVFHALIFVGRWADPIVPMADEYIATTTFGDLFRFFEHADTIGVFSLLVIVALIDERREFTVRTDVHVRLLFQISKDQGEEILPEEIPRSTNSIWRWRSSSFFCASSNSCRAWSASWMMRFVSSLYSGMASSCSSFSWSND